MRELHPEGHQGDLLTLESETVKGVEMNWKRMWTVSYCDLCRGGGMIICLEHEMPCDHDQLCPQCFGYEWYAHRVRDVIDFLIAKDVGWLYRTKRDAVASIEM